MTRRSRPIALVVAVFVLTLATGCPKKNKPPPVTQLWLGPDNACAELVSGELRCQGRNDHGELGGAPGSGPISVQGQGPLHSVRFPGRAICVTREAQKQTCQGEAPSATNPPAVVAPSCALLGGRVSCLGERFSPPPAFEGLTDVAELAEGASHACARLKQGTVVCWGKNDVGQLATPSPSYSQKPLAVQGLFGVTSLVAAGDGTCAILSDKTVRCWGRNDHGRLSTRHDSVLTVPTPVHF
jgi:hypothetical protein